MKSRDGNTAVAKAARAHRKRRTRSNPGSARKVQGHAAKLISQLEQDGSVKRIWERHLLNVLENAGLKDIFKLFVAKERYVLDLYSTEHKLNLEVDGSSHLKAEKKKADRVRDRRLKKLGIDVLRFWVWDVRGKPEEVVKCVKERLSSVKTDSTD
jgi:very-short-patch-repair endonuclease